MFQKHTQLIVVGSSEKPKPNSEDLFIYEGKISLKDDNNATVAEDYTTDFYENVIKCLTKVADWVFLPQLQSCKCAIK